MIDLVTLDYYSAIIQTIPLMIAIILAIFLYRMLNREVINEISDTSKVLGATQMTITYAEIPFPLVAVVAHLYNLNLDEFQKLWSLEKDMRCRKVLEVYKKDYLTTNFIEKFGSKFLLHGYVGSEAILGTGHGNHRLREVSFVSRSRKPAPPPTKEGAAESDRSNAGSTTAPRRKLSKTK